jgi:hypothetical protein
MASTKLGLSFLGPLGVLSMAIAPNGFISILNGNFIHSFFTVNRMRSFSMAKVAMQYQKSQLLV